MGYLGSIYGREVMRTKSGLPVKSYYFKSAFESGACSDRRSAKQYLLDVLNKDLISSSHKNAFGIAQLWGSKTDAIDHGVDAKEYPSLNQPAMIAKTLKENRGVEIPTKNIDFFLYKLADWDSNPDVESRTYNVGHRVVGEVITCGTGSIVLGAEESLRRRCNNLEEFLQKWPKIVSVGPIAAFK